MLKIAKKLGYADLKSFNAAIEKNPELHAHSRRADPRPLPAVHRRRCTPSCRSSSAACRRPSWRWCRSEAFREKEASGAEYDQGAPDGSRPGPRHASTPSDPRDAQDASTSSRPRTTRACPAITCRSPSRRSCRPCRRSASRAATRPSSRAGRSTPSGSARRSASTRIPTATTAACRTRCCAPSAWSSTPACTTSTGPASRWCSSSTTTRPSTRSTCRARPTATSSGPARRSAYKIGQLKILGAAREGPEGARRPSSTSARSTTRCSAPARCRMDVLEERIDAWIAAQKG